MLNTTTPTLILTTPIHPFYPVRRQQLRSSTTYLPAASGPWIKAVVFVLTMAGDNPVDCIPSGSRMHFINAHQPYKLNWTELRYNQCVAMQCQPARWRFNGPWDLATQEWVGGGKARGCGRREESVRMEMAEWRMWLLVLIYIFFLEHCRCPKCVWPSLWSHDRKYIFNKTAKSCAPLFCMPLVLCLPNAFSAYGLSALPPIFSGPLTPPFHFR